MHTVRAIVLVALVVHAAPGFAEVLVSQSLRDDAYTASGDFSGYTPRYAFDGNPDCWWCYWNGGTPPPAWIEVDLQRQVPVLAVRLVVAQLPDGETTHEVWMSRHPIDEDTSVATLVHTFTGYTRDRDVLEITLVSPILARHVQIRTTRSPSWVAWMEVQVFMAVRF